MSIREYLAGRLRKIVLFGLLFTVLFIPVGVFGGQYLSTTITAAFFGFLIVVIVIYILFFFRCPRCKGNLGYFAAHFGPLARMYKPIQFCPFCGTNLNERVQP